MVIVDLVSIGVFQFCNNIHDTTQFSSLTCDSDKMIINYLPAFWAIEHQIHKGR